MNESTLLDPEVALAEGRPVISIPLGMIRVSKIKVREEQVDSVDYQNLRDSMEKFGQLNAVIVREQPDPETGVKVYSLVAGLQRFTAARELGWTHIDAKVCDFDDAEFMKVQLIENMARIAQKPAQEGKHLVRIVATDPTMSAEQLAEECCQSVEWVKKRMSLTKLKDDIQELVDSGEIKVSNAVNLAKLPQDRQDEFVEDAINQTLEEFGPRVRDVLKEITAARKEARDSGAVAFEPRQSARKAAEIKSEYETLVEGERLIASTGVTEPKDVWQLAIAWVLNFDPESQERQRQRHEEQELKRAEKKKLNEADRERKKKDKAAKKPTPEQLMS